MRGVYTSGVLEAFDEAGLCFDSIVACSAGACAAASYLAGQAWRNRRVYLDLLDSKKLVRFSRLLTDGNVMDIDYFTDTNAGQKRKIFSSKGKIQASHKYEK